MKLTFFFLDSKDIVFENLWLYKAEDHKHDKTHFLKRMKSWLHATTKGVDELPKIYCLCSFFTCRIQM